MTIGPTNQTAALSDQWQWKRPSNKSRGILFGHERGCRTWYTSCKSTRPDPLTHLQRVKVAKKLTVNALQVGTSIIMQTNWTHPLQQ